MTIDEKINALIDLVKKIVVEQATCEVSGHQWGGEVLNELSELQNATPVNIH